MTSAKRRLLATAFSVVLVVGAAAFFINSSVIDAWKSRRITAGQICFSHVGETDKAMPEVCVTGQARAPHPTHGVVVILSAQSLKRFVKLVDAQQDAPQRERVAFGAYQVRDSIHSPQLTRILSKAQMDALVEQLITLLDSPQRATEKAGLDDVRRRLKQPALQEKATLITPLARR